MQAQVANTEPNQVVSRNGTANANNSESAEDNNTNSLEAGHTMEDEVPSISTAPDGGWGWLVVLGAFMIYFMCQGFLFSFGVFVEDFVDYFESSKSAVGGVGSLMIAMAAASGNCDYLISEIFPM